MFYELQSIKSFIAASMAMASLILASGCTVSVGSVSALLVKDSIEENYMVDAVVKVARHGHDAIFFSDETSLSPMEKRRLALFIKKSSAKSLDENYVVSSKEGVVFGLAERRIAGVSRYLASLGHQVSTLPSDLVVAPLPGNTVKVMALRNKTYASGGAEAVGTLVASRDK